MSQSVDAGFLTRLGLTETEIGWLLRLTPVAGSAVTLSSVGEDVSFDSASFLGSPGFAVSEQSIFDQGTPTALDITIPIDSTGPIVKGDFDRGKWRNAQAEVWVIDYGATSNFHKVFDGFVGRADSSDSINGTFELKTRAERNNDFFVQYIQATCPYAFGDADCGVTKADFEVTGTVATVSSNSSFTVTISNPDGFDFSRGGLLWLTGANADRTAEIRKWVAGTSTVNLWFAAIDDIAVGDTFKMHPDCLKTRAACQAFNNEARFGGYDHTPAEQFFSAG